MIFVHWDDAALDELADIWVAASVTDREYIEVAVQRTNSKLEVDPLEGESRSGSTRVLIERPLTVWFTFDDAIDNVIVYRVLRPTRS